VKAALEICSPIFIHKSGSTDQAANRKILNQLNIVGKMPEIFQEFRSATKTITSIKGIIMTCPQITKDIVNNITVFKMIVIDYCRHQNNELKSRSFDVILEFLKTVSDLDKIRFLNENKKLVKDLIVSVVMHLQVFLQKILDPSFKMTGIYYTCSNQNDTFYQHMNTHMSHMCSILSRLFNQRPIKQL
jgi:hypothetical protein